MCEYMQLGIHSDGALLIWQHCRINVSCETVNHAQVLISITNHPTELPSVTCFLYLFAPSVYYTFFIRSNIEVITTAVG